jgi:hypothetical protein
MQIIVCLVLYARSVQKHEGAEGTGVLKDAFSDRD